MNDITPEDLPKRLREIAEYAFNNPFKRQSDIAKELGITQSRVSFVLSHPKVLRVYKVFAKARVGGLLPKSTKALEDCIDQKVNLQVKFNAARSVLEDQKILNNSQEITIRNDITIKSVQELRQIVDKAVQTSLPQEAIDAEIIDTTVHPTTQDTQNDK